MPGRVARAISHMLVCFAITSTGAGRSVPQLAACSIVCISSGGSSAGSSSSSGSANSSWPSTRTKCKRCIPGERFPPGQVPASPPSACCCPCAWPPPWPPWPAAASAPAAARSWPCSSSAWTSCRRRPRRRCRLRRRLRARQRGRHGRVGAWLEAARTSCPGGPPAAATRGKRCRPSTPPSRALPAAQPAARPPGPPAPSAASRARAAVSRFCRSLWNQVRAGRAMISSSCSSMFTACVHGVEGGRAWGSRRAGLEALP